MKKIGGNLITAVLLALTFLNQIPVALALDVENTKQLDNDGGNCHAGGDRG